MKKIFLSLLLIVVVNENSKAQSGGKRYLEEVFPSYTLQSNIVYGTGSKNVLDTYSGSGDTQNNRPLVLFIHGGGFKDGDKVSNFGTRVCGALARRGYFVASINYRLTPTQNTDQQSFEAMIRALQDAKAAVRFFRKNTSQYGIDTTQIFATGSSAGSITALHLAYFDQSEIPSYVTDTSLRNLEGTSGTPSYSSKIHGVINNWGAITDTSWMKKGDVPVYCVHGLTDQTVFYEQVPSDGPFLYGSKHLISAAQRLKIPNGLRTFTNTGHTLDNSSTKQDSAIKDFSNWLYTILKKESSVGSVEKEKNIPTGFELFQNYPNPFNPETVIKFTVPVVDANLTSTFHVTLKVYDTLGNKIATLVNENKNSGIYFVDYNVKTGRGASLQSGAYFYQLTTSNPVYGNKLYTQTKKMLLLK